MRDELPYFALTATYTDINNQNGYSYIILGMYYVAGYSAHKCVE